MTTKLPGCTDELAPYADELLAIALPNHAELDHRLPEVHRGNLASALCEVAQASDEPEVLAAAAGLLALLDRPAGALAAWGRLRLIAREAVEAGADDALALLCLAEPVTRILGRLLPAGSQVLRGHDQAGEVWEELDLGDLDQFRGVLEAGGPVVARAPTAADLDEPVRDLAVALTARSSAAAPRRNSADREASVPVVTPLAAGVWDVDGHRLDLCSKPRRSEQFAELVRAARSGRSGAKLGATAAAGSRLRDALEASLPDELARNLIKSAGSRGYYRLAAEVQSK